MDRFLPQKIYRKHFVKTIKERYVILQGGSRSGKTYAILQWFILLAKSGVEFDITITSTTVPHLREGAFKTFLEIYPDAQYLKNPFSAKINNANFLFRSFESENSAKGSARDYLFVNECNDVDKKIIDQLLLRTRKQVFFDFNPTNEFWINEYINDNNFLQTTWVDNVFLTPAQKQYFLDIEKKALAPTASVYDRYRYEVYFLGKYGALQGDLFNVLKTYNEDVLNQEFDSCMAYIDVADEGTDYLAMAVCKSKGKNIYIVDVIYTQLNTNFTLPKCAEILKQHNVTHCRVESNSMGAMFANQLQQLVPNTGIYKAASTTNKITRIRLQSDFIMENFYFKAPDNRNKMYSEFVNEVLSFKADGKNKNDDATDCLSGLSIFVRSMLKDIFQA